MGIELVRSSFRGSRTADVIRLCENAGVDIKPTASLLFLLP